MSSGYINLPVVSGGGSGAIRYAMTGGNVSLTNNVNTQITGLAIPLDVGRWSLTYNLILKNTPYWTYLSWTGANTQCVVSPVLVNALTGPANLTPASGDFMTQIDSQIGDFVFKANLSFDIIVSTAGTYTLTLAKKGSGDGTLYGISYATVQALTFS